MARRYLPGMAAALLAVVLFVALGLPGNAPAVPAGFQPQRRGQCITATISTLVCRLARACKQPSALSIFACPGTAKCV